MSLLVMILGYVQSRFVKLSTKADVSLLLENMLGQELIALDLGMTV